MAANGCRTPYVRYTDYSMLRRKSEPSNKKPRFSAVPDFIAERVESIDFKYLKTLGVTTCLIDLDNTVVERAMYVVSPQIQKALRDSGMDIYIATNRPKGRDLKDLKELLGASGVVHPHGIYAKPTRRYFDNALKDKQLKRSEVVMIGDRYFQDMLGANRAGINSLLVAKLGKPVNGLDKLVSTIELFITRKISKRYHTK